MINTIKHIVYLLLPILLFSCSGTKGLMPEDKLFSEIEVSITDKENITNKNSLNKQITDATPLVNDPGFLNIKTGFYHIYDDADSGFRNTVKNKLGSKPVVFNPQVLENTTAKLNKVMIDNGHFESIVLCDSIAKKRKIYVTCKIEAGPRYTIDSIIFPYDTLPITKELKKHYNLKYIKEGDYYQQSNLVLERNSLAQEGKNRGYRYLGTKDIQYYVDTTRNNLGADIYVEILPPKSDDPNHKRYVNGDIYVQTNYSLETSNLKELSTYDENSGLYFLGQNKLLRPSSLDNFILIDKGEYVNESNQKLSINRLLEMGIFKFVNNKIEARGDTLDQYFLLTPDKIKNITGELELNNRSGNLFGTAGSVAYTHKNIFRGAERFSIGLSGGIETQFGEKSLINSSELSLETSLEFPRLAIPFFHPNTTKYFIPKTLVSGAVSLETRVNFYTIQNQKFKYGFRWKEDRNKTHELYPFDLVHFYVSDKSEAFEALINDPANLRLFESYQDVMIFGLYYSFTYNNTADVGSRNNLFFKPTFESAGNLFSAISKREEIFNTTVSQYVKITGDFRKYWKVRDSDLATRVYAGAGIAYGNSSELPYSRQFSIGGANSLRAYRLRGLGPGENIINEQDSTQFIDQTGDIKLELNLEYRFPIIGFFKGAAFVDAGNIWLIREGEGIDTNKKFYFNNFYNQIAIGTGLGLRLDFEFFVFRFDFAFPIRGPKSDGKFGWQHQNINPFDKTWRQDNLRLNLGIGYPF